MITNAEIWKHFCDMTEKNDKIIRAIEFRLDEEKWYSSRGDNLKSLHLARIIKLLIEIETGMFEL